MFISKRKFERELEKARESVWETVDQRRFQDDIWHNIYELKERVNKLEGKRDNIAVNSIAVKDCCSNERM